jgi:hypothetical protein
MRIPGAWPFVPATRLCRRPGDRRAWVAATLVREEGQPALASVQIRDARWRNARRAQPDPCLPAAWDSCGQQGDDAWAPTSLKCQQRLVAPAIGCNGAVRTARYSTPMNGPADSGIGCGIERGAVAGGPGIGPIPRPLARSRPGPPMCQQSHAASRPDATPTLTGGSHDAGNTKRGDGNAPVLCSRPVLLMR